MTHNTEVELVRNTGEPIGRTCRVSKFLFLPKKLGGKWKWLERAYIWQMKVGNIYMMLDSSLQREDLWIDVDWVMDVVV